jgi:pimeloyl-ACP methyl ester carboxylesterase
MRMTPLRQIRLTGAFTSLFLALATVALADTSPFRAEVSGSGPPMLLIPGLNSSGAVWDGVIDHFKSRYTCHALTLAGFAGQPPLAAPALSTVRDAILTYIDQHQLERPIVAGHSLGAFLAFWVAATAPTKVGSVIAIDGVPFLPALMDPSATADSVRARAEMMRRAMENESAEQRERSSALSLASMISDPAHIAMAQRWATSSDARTTALFTTDLMTTDLRADVSRIETPVLLVAAGGLLASNPAALTTVEQAYERQIAAISRHRTVVARQARHFIMLDDPLFLFATIDEFLGR